jgi:hypothetical protein
METPKRTRGRPRKPDALTPAQIQRAYRARLTATGKAVRVVQLDAAPGSDSEADAIADRAYYAELRDKYHHALLRIEFLEEDRARLDKRNAYLETELKHLERVHDITLSPGPPPSRKRRGRGIHQTDTNR